MCSPAVFARQPLPRFFRIGHIIGGQGDPWPSRQPPFDPQARNSFFRLTIFCNVFIFRMNLVVEMHGCGGQFVDRGNSFSDFRHRFF